MEDSVGVEDCLAYLKEHDGQWLARILKERCKHVGYHGWTNQGGGSGLGQLQTLHSRPDTSLAGPFDVTAPTLPPGMVVTEHVAMLRTFPWEATELGPMSSWPIDLRRMVNFTLQDRKSAVLWYGPMRRCIIYNEAYNFTLGHRHPWAHGKVVTEVWPELVNLDFAKAFDHADRTGQPSFQENVLFFVSRNDYNEEVHAGWTIRPIPGRSASGTNLGYYNGVTENTREVLHERRMVTIQALEEETSKASSMRDYYVRVLRGLEANIHEIPFAALYGPAPAAKDDISDSDSGFTGGSSTKSDYGSAFAGKEWTLEGVLAPPDYVPPLPSRVDLDSGNDLLTPMFRSAMLSKAVQVLRCADGSLPKHIRDMAKSRAWEGDFCDTAILCPLYSTHQEHRSGFLLLGLNTRRTYDQEYQRFVRLLVNQLTTTLSSVVLAEDEARRARMSARLAAQDRMQLVEKLAASTQGLRDSEMRFRSMADLAPIGIFEFDAQGHLLFANQRWLELTGNNDTPSRETIRRGKTVVEADQEAFEAHWHILLNGEQVDNLEFRLSRPYLTDESFDGERLQGETWVLMAAYALRDESDSNGGDSSVKGVFGCLVDISRQKWMEGFQARKVKEQEERRRQQENFMDKTNHEARNPLAAITLCADEMYTTIRDLTDHPGKIDVPLSRQTASTLLESVETIIACAKHQKRIIEDVLVASKLESGLLTMSPCPVQVTEVVDSALKMFKTELQRSHVDLQYTIGHSYRDADVDWVLLDSTRLLQVLLNLLTNAIKFTKFEDARKITVRLEATATCPTESDLGVKFVSAPLANETFASSQPVYIYISIQDTGPGISSHDFTSLFERFRQSPNQYTKTYATYGGSGLGLWISKELCSQMGGQIGAASSPTGSTFAFYVQTNRCSPRTTEPRPLPMKQARENIQRELAAAMNNLNHNNSKPAEDRPTAALIVEDNLLNQKVMQKQLTRAGLSVVVANHGQEALEYIYGADRPPLDVVLMDIEMPVLDGIAATRAIRARESSERDHIHLPILGVTANARQEQLDNARSAGMDDIITKPFHMTDLLPAIDRVKR